MDSRIDRIRQSFITRKTEQSDTHDYIQRHDPDYHKNKSGHHHHDHPYDDDSDMTDISVESLIIFLEGLKKDTSNTPPQDSNQDTPNKDMAKAINAYGGQTQQPTKRFTYLNEDENEEINRDKINNLINKLKDILNQKIEHVTLEPASGFLSSIKKTVEKYSAV